VFLKNIIIANKVQEYAEQGIKAATGSVTKSG
jgi:hypothetical protein